MSLFNTPRGEKAPLSVEVSHIRQIETLNTRLEDAREIFAADRVFPVLNQEDHYVVAAPLEKGFYIVNVVNAEGCCPSEQQRSDLLKGYYCEHRLAVELFKEAQKAEDQSTGDEEKVEAAATGVATPS